MADSQRPEPHALSDSEPEVQITGKRKKTARKTKLATPQTDAGNLSGLPPLPGPVTTPPLQVPVASQDSSDLAEMKSMFQQMKDMTERNSAFVELLAKAGQSRQEVKNVSFAQPFTGSVEGAGRSDRPDLDNVSHEQVVETEESGLAENFDNIPAFADPHDYGWETDEDNDPGEDEGCEGSLAMLQRVMFRKPVSVAPAAALGAPVVATPTVSGAGVKVTSSSALTEGRKVFTLSDGLCEGTLRNELQEVYKKMRKPTQQRIEVDENLAGALAYYYSFTKPKKALNDIARLYTGIKTVPEVRVQPLNEEVKFVEGRKLAEDGMFWATKGVVAALTAITPTLELVLARGKRDPELDEQAKPMLDAVKVLVHTHTQLTADRVLNVHKVVNTPLGKEIIKRKLDKYGEKELPTEHLLGEDLGERNKEVIKSARAADTVMNTSLAPKKWRKSGEFYRPPWVNRRARGYRGGRGGQSRGGPYTPWNARVGGQAGRYNKPADYSGAPPYQTGQRGLRTRGAATTRGFLK